MRSMFDAFSGDELYLTPLRPFVNSSESWCQCEWDELGPDQSNVAQVG